ncbi:hypothetical protein BESB_011940 [Besnoitia besnoiti]|uniref:Uncharacterized protein n=1 Tax=Besnoitia besnoiti TaxID=94643 RepID=A0A2A9MB19_BESBE|nr:hypothetical protein BESB_011940 [Besnoitia besnoiti]PFH32582.1 hypothetical protein BESB_011940 [Besnoitia besnoiti]
MEPRPPGTFTPDSEGDGYRNGAEFTWDGLSAVCGSPPPFPSCQSPSSMTAGKRPAGKASARLRDLFMSLLQQKPPVWGVQEGHGTRWLGVPWDCCSAASSCVDTASSWRCCESETDAPAPGELCYSGEANCRGRRAGRVAPGHPPRALHAHEPQRRPRSGPWRHAVYSDARSQHCEGGPLDSAEKATAPRACRAETLPPSRSLDGLSAVRHLRRLAELEQEAEAATFSQLERIAASLAFSGRPSIAAARRSECWHGPMSEEPEARGGKGDSPGNRASVYSLAASPASQPDAVQSSNVAFLALSPPERRRSPRVAPCPMQREESSAAPGEDEVPQPSAGTKAARGEEPSTSSAGDGGATGLLVSTSGTCCAAGRELDLANPLPARVGQADAGAETAAESCAAGLPAKARRQASRLCSEALQLGDCGRAGGRAQGTRRCAQRPHDEMARSLSQQEGLRMSLLPAAAETNFADRPFTFEADPDGWAALSRARRCLRRRGVPLEALESNTATLPGMLSLLVTPKGLAAPCVVPDALLQAAPVPSWLLWWLCGRRAAEAARPEGRGGGSLSHAARVTQSAAGCDRSQRLRKDCGTAAVDPGGAVASRKRAAEAPRGLQELRRLVRKPAPPRANCSASKVCHDHALSSGDESVPKSLLAGYQTLAAHDAAPHGSGESGERGRVREDGVSPQSPDRSLTCEHVAADAPSVDCSRPVRRGSAAQVCSAPSQDRASAPEVDYSAAAGGVPALVGDFDYCREGACAEESSVASSGFASQAADVADAFAFSSLEGALLATSRHTAEAWSACSPAGSPLTGGPSESKNKRSRPATERGTPSRRGPVPRAARDNEVPRRRACSGFAGLWTEGTATPSRDEGSDSCLDKFSPRSRPVFIELCTARASACAHGTPLRRSAPASRVCTPAKRLFDSGETRSLRRLHPGRTPRASSRCKCRFASDLPASASPRSRTRMVVASAVGSPAYPPLEVLTMSPPTSSCAPRRRRTHLAAGQEANPSKGLAPECRELPTSAACSPTRLVDHPGEAAESRLQGARGEENRDRKGGRAREMEDMRRGDDTHCGRTARGAASSGADSSNCEALGSASTAHALTAVDQTPSASGQERHLCKSSVNGENYMSNNTSGCRIKVELPLIDASKLQGGRSEQLQLRSQKMAFVPGSSWSTARSRGRDLPRALVSAPSTPQGRVRLMLLLEAASATPLGLHRRMRRRGQHAVQNPGCREKKEASVMSNAYGKLWPSGEFLAMSQA